MRGGDHHALRQTPIEHAVTYGIPLYGWLRWFAKSAAPCCTLASTTALARNEPDHSIAALAPSPPQNLLQSAVCLLLLPPLPRTGEGLGEGSAPPVVCCGMPNNYLLDTAWHQQRRRLAGLEAWFDPGTIRHLEHLGVGPGWRCLEVGAGGGSIATWLCQRVGPTGSVLATDLDTRFLDPLIQPNLTVQRHDLLAGPLPAAAFDLAHARFVIEHLADRSTALARLAAALKPGGWLLIEDTDSASWLPAPEAAAAAAALFTRWTDAYVRVCRAAGTDPYAGRRLHGELRALGLSQVGAEGRVFMVQGGSPTAEVWRLTAEQVSPSIIADGLLSADDMARTLALLADPTFAWMEGLVMAAWGQRPSPPAQNITV